MQIQEMTLSVVIHRDFICNVELLFHINRRKRHRKTASRWYTQKTVKCLNEFLHAKFFRLFISLSPQNEITISTAVK